MSWRQLAVRVHVWSGLVAGPLVLVLALSGAILVFAPEIEEAIHRPGAAPERLPLVPLRALHASLHAGRVGTVVVGILGLVLVAEGLTGLWLYGRRLARRTRAPTMHRVLGTVSLAFAAAVGVSGALLAFGTALATTDAPASAARQVLERLHYGDFAGWASRVVYAVIGVALAALAVTGYLLVARDED